MASSHTREEVLDIIEQGARNRGIPVDDFMRFAYAETGGSFNPNASRGPNSAKGLFQFVPQTAREYHINGRELDPVANTDAAAQLYQHNRQTLTRQHGRDGIPYLSGKAEPDGLDMYVAHQQGAAGYGSIQAALQTGEFSLSSTRPYILNNVNSTEFTRVTGKDYATFAHMGDKEMAQAYVQYWNAKFHSFEIPEKNIGPSQPAPSHPPVASAPHAQPHQPQPQPGAAQPPAAAKEEKPGITLDRAYGLTEQYDNVQYKMGAKNPDGGTVDCSGWVAKLQNATMDEINAKAGHQVLTKKDHFNPAFHGAAEIIDKAQKESGVLIEGKNVTKDVLKEGMVIGEHNGSANGKGRFHGIDHITMVVRDPKSGELMISQSSSHKGVHLTPVDEYLKYKQSHGVELYATDPLAKARHLLKDQPAQAQSHATPGHKEPARAAHGALREGDHGPEVKALQEKLHGMGYRGADGKPLQPDGDFGPNTKSALQSFQKDRHLERDGIAGPKTHQALQSHGHDAAKESKGPQLDHANHPDHKLFKQTQDAVHRLDAQHGRQPDPVSTNVAGSLTVAAKKAGLTEVNHAVLSDDRSQIYAVQGDLKSPFKQIAQVDTMQAANTSLQQSSEAMHQVNQQQAQQGREVSQAQLQAQQQQQQQPNVPGR